jgi:tetratricopeptide (TPR) repeat protein
MPGTRNLRGRGVRIRPEAVREARAEAGLTLAALASDQVSRQAIHQIERGQILPTLRTLHLIAERTGKSIEFFLDGDPSASLEAKTTELERLFISRDLVAATRFGERLLEPGLEANHEAVARLWTGAAYVGLNRPDEALGHLSRAATLLKNLGDSWLLVEARDWQSCALHLKDAPGALELAEQALSDCRALTPVPRATEARILGHIGAICVGQRKWRRALGAYEAAVAISSTLRDLREVAMMHHNLSIAYQRVGLPENAVASAQRALALYAIQSDHAARARMQSDYGDLLLKQGDLNGAERQLSQALAVFESLGDEPRGRNYTLLSLAEVALAQQRTAEARAMIDDSIAGATRLNEMLALACAHQLNGRLKALESHHEESDHEFRVALSILEKAQMIDRLGDCHFEYARVLEARGNLADAAVHFKLAFQFARGIPDAPASRASWAEVEFAV